MGEIHIPIRRENPHGWRHDRERRAAYLRQWRASRSPKGEQLDPVDVERHRASVVRWLASNGYGREHWGLPDVRPLVRSAGLE